MTYGIPLTHLKIGTRVRSTIAKDSPLFKTGEVIGFFSPGPWVKIRWDDGTEQNKLAGELVNENAPYPPEPDADGYPF